MKGEGGGRRGIGTKQRRKTIIMASGKRRRGKESRENRLRNGDSSDYSHQPPRGHCNKILYLLLILTLVLNIYHQTLTTTGLYGQINDDDNFDFPGYEKEDEASSIIRRSYAKSYAHILPCDDDRPSGKECMQKTLDYFETPNTNGTLPSVPWWFLTLMR